MKGEELLMKERKKIKNFSMRHNFTTKIFLFLIFISQFNLQCQINIEDVKYSISSNRLLWRANHFLEKFKNSTNVSNINNTKYEKLFFKKNEAENIRLEKIDSLETDSLIFYEFTFLYRCSYEDDVEINSTLNDYIKEWNDTNATKCECCKILSMTERDGELYGIPNCVNEKGIVAISLFTNNEIFFLSGKCVFIDEKFGSIYFEKKGVDVNSIETYIRLKLWNEFTGKKYSIKDLKEKYNNYWEFTVCKNMGCEKTSNYLLNVETGKILLVN